jgi:hypothetical protein
MRIPEPGIVTMHPNRFAGIKLVTGNDFLLTTLFLGEKEISMNCKRGTARSYGSAPQLFR